MDKKIDVLLVIPPFEYGSLDESSVICPPLGIVQIASVIENKGYNVEILDSRALKLNDEQIKKQIESKKPKIVGITSTTPEFKRALDALKLTKKVDPKIVTIMGGAHPTILPQTVNSRYIDYIIMGEGEPSIVKLVDYVLKKKGKLKDIKGVGYKEEGKITLNELNPFIKNLDELPIPAYHLLPMNKYKNYPMFEDGRKFGTIVTSRGCPFSCIYCSSSVVFGHRWRAQTPERTLKEIKLLYDKYGIRHVFFQEDEFTINHKRVLEICNLLIKNRLDLKWGCASRVDHINEELIAKMSKAGCKEISFGVECGYEEGLKNINKRITLTQARNAVRLAKKYNIFVCVNFIIGFPWEGKKEVKKTIRFAKSLNPDAFFFHTLVPYPGTKIYKQMKEENLILNDDFNNYIQYPIPNKDLIVRTRYLSNKELKYWSNRALLEINLNPKFIIRKLLRVRSIKNLKGNLKAGKGLLKNTLKNIILG